VCLLFDIPLPLSFVRNHTQLRSERGDQVKLNNRVRFGLQQAFHKQLAMSIHHGSGNSGLMDIHADILFLTHKGAPFR